MRYHSYIFFDLARDLTPTDKKKLQSNTKSFLSCFRKHGEVLVEAYGMLAMRSDMYFMLHLGANAPEEVQALVRDILHTPLGRHLRISYTLLGTEGSSQYNATHAPKDAESSVPHKYLIVYPFTKTTEWHLLPFTDRKKIMQAHVDVGLVYSETISQMLLYSYGIDDHEFIVSYMTDSIPDFQKLVMDMRATESRKATKNDLPIFMCIHMPVEEALLLL